MEDGAVDETQVQCQSWGGRLLYDRKGPGVCGNTDAVDSGIRSTDHTGFESLRGKKMLKIAEIIVCILMIAVVLIQPSKSGETGDMLTGNQNLSLFKNTKSRGYVFVAEIVTWILLAAYFAMLIYERVAG